MAGLAPDVTGTLNFFDYDRWDKVSKPASYAIEIPEELKEEAKRRMDAATKRIDVEVGIYNGRPLASHLTLDTAGICFQQAPTKMTGQDFYDVAKLHDTYFPEVIEYVKRMTGATAVLPFDHAVRNRTLVGKVDGTSGPIPAAHNDSTLDSGPTRCRNLLKGGPVPDEVLKHRYGILNVWRRWDGGNDWPLAVCAGDSLALDDLIGMQFLEPDRTVEVYYARHNPNQTFFWFPDMTKDEAIILKIYDSDATGQTQPKPGASGQSAVKWTLHGAFNNPRASFDEGTAKGPRESCEVRCLVLWAPEPLASQAELKGMTRSYETGKQVVFQFYDPTKKAYADAAADGVNPLAQG